MKDDKSVGEQKEQTSSSEKNSSEENSSAENKSRRKALRGILVTSGVIAGLEAMPDKWQKPVVDSVVLPAHAGGSSPV